MVQPTIAANNFELKPALINMVQQSRFGGSAVEDSHDHITTFLVYCNTYKCNGVPADVIRLSLFPFSLRDSEKDMAAFITASSERHLGSLGASFL